MIWAIASVVAFAIAATGTALLLKTRRVTEPAPGIDRWRTDAVPRVGGAAILVAFLVGVVVLAFADKVSTRQAFGFVGALTLISVLGLIDDMRGLSPLTKLSGQIVGTSILLVTGTSVEIVSVQPFSTLLTFLWMIGITNALNLLDNMDGLAAGVSFVGLVFLAIHAGLADLTEASALAVVLAAAVLGFLPFNLRLRHRAAIFMGDGGSQLLGFGLAWLALATSWQQASGFVAAIAVPFLVLAIPILDTALVSVMRTIEGRPISQGGRDHTSHRLVLKGISEKRAVVLLIGASVALGAGALAFVQFDRLALALIGLGLAAAVLIHFAIFLVQARRSETEGHVPEIGDRFGWFSIDTYRLHKRRFAEALLDLVLIVAAYYLAYVLRYDQLPDTANSNLIAKSVPILVATRFIAFSYFGLYRGIWRYAGTRDVARCVAAVAASEIASVTILTFAYRFDGYSRSLFVIDAVLCLVLVAGARLAERGLGEWLHGLRDRRQTPTAVIVGAGDAGNSLLRELRRRDELLVVGFVDDDPRKRGSRAQGVKVLGDHRDIQAIIEEHRPQVVYVTIPDAPPERLDQIRTACVDTGVTYKSIRGYSDSSITLPTRPAEVKCSGETAT